MSRADAQVANEGRLIHMEDRTAHKEITGEVFYLERSLVFPSSSECSPLTRRKDKFKVFHFLKKRHLKNTCGM